MNEIARRVGGLPVEPIGAPVLPERVEYLVGRYLDYAQHGNLGRFGVPAIPAEDRDAVAAVLSQLDADGAPATFQTVTAWLMHVTAGMGFPPTQKEVATLSVAVQMACSDLPGWLFNLKSVQEALRTFKRVPSAAEVRELLAGIGAQHLGTIRALRAMMAVTKVPEPERESQEVRTALAAKLREVAVEAEARAIVADAPATAAPATARHLSGEALAKARAENPLIQAARAMQAQMKARA